MHQIEKRYLLNDSVMTLIDDMQLNYKDIIEFYTVAKVCKEVKFIKIDSDYHKIIKSGAIGSSNIKRVKIKKSDYNRAEKISIGYKIRKKRYLIPKSENRYYIYEFKKDLRNIYILEVLFKRRKDFINFVLPDLFQGFVIKDITRDERYQDKNLALLGNPNKNQYNIYEVFKDIELGRNENLRTIIFGEMKTSDSIRIILYKLFVDLRISKDLIIETEASDGLDEFSKSLNRTLLLLQEYKNIFDKQILKRVITNLKTMKKSLKRYRDLKFIEGELKSIDDILDKHDIKKITKNIYNSIAQERHIISRFFTTREFAIIFKQYELLLKENNRSFLSIEAQTSIEKSLKDKIAIEYKKTIMLCEKYEGCEDEISYKKIKNSFKKLKTLLKNFILISNKNRYKSAYDKSSKIIKTISKLQKVEKQAIIFETYLKNFQNHQLNKNRLIKDISIKKSILTDKLYKDIESFKKQKRSLT